MLENGARYTYKMYTIPSGYTLVDRAAQASASVTCKVEAQGSLLANWTSNDIKVEFKKYYGKKYIIVTHPHSYVYSYNPKLTLYYTEKDSSALKSEVCNIKASNTNSTRKNGQDGVAIDYYIVPANKEYTKYSLRVTRGIDSSVYLSSVPSLLKDKETLGEFEDMVAANLPEVSQSSFEGVWMIDDENENSDVGYGLYISSGKGYRVIMKNGYYYYDDVEYFAPYTLQGSKVSFKRESSEKYEGSVVINGSGMIIISDDGIISFKKETESYPTSFSSIYYSKVEGFWEMNSKTYYYITSNAWYETLRFYNEMTYDHYSYYYNDIDSDKHGTYSITSGKIEFFDEYGNFKMTGVLDINGDDIILVINSESFSRNYSSPNSLGDFFKSEIHGLWNDEGYKIDSDSWYKIQRVYDEYNEIYNYYYNDVDSDKHGTYSIVSDKIEFFDKYGNFKMTGTLNMNEYDVMLVINDELFFKNTTYSYNLSSLNDFFQSKIQGQWKYDDYEESSEEYGFYIVYDYISMYRWYKILYLDGDYYFDDVNQNNSGNYTLSERYITFYNDDGSYSNAASLIVSLNDEDEITEIKLIAETDALKLSKADYTNVFPLSSKTTE